MSLSVNTNIASLAARRALGAADAALVTTVQRLSSGLRVNSARDDAAGLAIAERMTSRLRGMQQATRNVNDGLSLFGSADGALGSMTGCLQRMRELAVQAMNASNGTADRQALDGEMQQKRQELDRIAAATTFNGRALLDGSFGTALFQVGAGSSDGLDVALDTSMRSAALGAVATATSGDLRTLSDGSGGYPFAATYTTVPISQLDFSRPDIPFSGGSIRSVGTPATDYSGGNAAQFTVDGRTVNLGADYGSLAGLANTVQSQLDAAGSGAYIVSQDGTRLNILKTASAPAATSAPAVVALGGSGPLAGASGSNGTAATANSHAGFSVDGHRVALTADHSGDFAGLVADIQGQLDRSARGAYRVSGSGAGLSISRSSGVQLPVVGSFTDTGAAVFASAPRTGVVLRAGDLTVQLGNGPPVAVVGNFLSPEALADAVRQRVGNGVTTLINNDTGALEINAAQALTVGGNAAQPSGSLAFTSLVNAPAGSLDDVDASTADAARRSLLRIDAAIDGIGAQRSQFGALQSRFEAVADSLLSDGVVVAGARARIVDADMASETAALSRRQVLQQAALAMVAQANTGPRDVLALLR